MSDEAFERSDRPACWGCECEVPVRDGMHEEDTGNVDLVYVYPCTALLPATKEGGGDG